MAAVLVRGKDEQREDARVAGVSEAEADDRRVDPDLTVPLQVVGTEGAEVLLREEGRDVASSGRAARAGLIGYPATLIGTSCETVSAPDIARISSR